MIGRDYPTGLVTERLLVEGICPLIAGLAWRVVKGVVLYLLYLLVVVVVFVLLLFRRDMNV